MRHCAAVSQRKQDTDVPGPEVPQRNSVFNAQQKSLLLMFASGPVVPSVFVCYLKISHFIKI